MAVSFNITRSLEHLCTTTHTTAKCSRDRVSQAGINRKQFANERRLLEAHVWQGYDTAH